MQPKSHQLRNSCILVAALQGFYLWCLLKAPLSNPCNACLRSLWLPPPSISDMWPHAITRWHNSCYKPGHSSHGLMATSSDPCGTSWLPDVLWQRCAMKRFILQLSRISRQQIKHLQTRTYSKQHLLEAYVKTKQKCECEYVSSFIFLLSISLEN